MSLNPTPPSPASPPPSPVPYASPVPAAVSPDAEHLRLLALFHYIYGGITAVFSSFALFHLIFGIVMIVNPNAFPSAPGQPPPPPFLGWMFAGMGGCIVLLGWTLGGLTILSGRYIARRRHRTFSMIIAGINCISIPFGTLLGVFTILVLSRPTVRAMYVEVSG